MKQRILITGGTGLIGKKLIGKLLSKGHSVAILSRKRKKIKQVDTFIWDVYKQYIDEHCMKDVDTIIHLAGEGIADAKWTKERKKEIIDSRVFSTNLLYKAITEQKPPLKSFICSSAVGFYGDRGDELLTEESKAGKGFMAKCCELWEEAADQGKSLDIRLVKIRTGFVLAKNGGGLPAMEKPIRMFAGAPLGTGKQWIPWIHINDIVNLYVEATEDDTYEGIYNGCAPYPVTNTTLTKAIAKQIGRPIWPFKIPEKVLSMLLGQMSNVITMSNNTSAQKLLSEDYIFEFTHLDDALRDIYKK